MQLSIKKIGLSLLAVSALTVLSTSAYAEAAKKTTNKTAVKAETYTEDQFLNTFSGKMKTVVVAKLGNPAKKETSVKPAGAGVFLGKVGADEKNSKRVNVEMWYYKNLVNYDPKNKYKETEITFVNDKVMNIAFFNNR